MDQGKALFWPVSYTHLDVYKRQEALRAVIDAIGGVDHDPLGLESAEIYRIRELIKEAY